MNSSEVKGFFTGLLIGDAYIDKGVTKRAFEIRSIDKEFINKIKEEIESCTPFKCIENFTPAHYSCGCNHKDAWSIRIPAHPYFNKIYHKFYNDYRHRIITKYIPKYLTPYGVALWYMCDGYVCLVGKTKNKIRNRRVDFCTDRYTLQEVQSLQKTMLNKFNLNTSIIKHNTFYRLRIKKESYKTFLELIYPYMIPSMYYKLYLGYDMQPIWMSDEMWKLQNSIKQCNPPTK